jgi:hypothetical protein
MDTRGAQRAGRPFGILPIPERAIGGQRLRIKAQDFKRGEYCNPTAPQRVEN